MKGIGMKRFSGISVAVALIATATLAGCPPQTTVDLHTQNFAAGAAATSLAGKQLHFMPDSSQSFYSRTVTDGVTDFNVPVVGQTIINFALGDPFVLTLPAGSEVSYFGQLFSTLFIGSNGTVAFGSAGTGNSSLANHFGARQISLLPVDATASGTVSFGLFSDAVVVTFDSVDGSSFQSEFFVSGEMEDDISIAYPVVSATAGGVVGLSRGQLAGANQTEIDNFLADFRNSDLGRTNTGT